MGNTGAQWSALTRGPAGVGPYRSGVMTGVYQAAEVLFIPSPWMGEYKVLSVIKNPNSMTKHNNFLFMSQSNMNCVESGGWKLTQSFRDSSSKDFPCMAPISSWALESSTDFLCIQLKGLKE